jgi:predicted 3-demethylubiquinone-9 3-methyltransferase (glyoxalase superfamily)
MMETKITPFLWFDDKAEEAVAFYATVFPSVRVHEMTRYGDGGPGPAGSVMTIAFEVAGQSFMGLNGGPHFPFTEAVSFVVACDTQEEIDEYWKALTADGGRESQCGWLKDKFGLSWQIVPREMSELVRKPAALQAMMGMKKIDVAAMKAAG